jgi:hypothetical protein
MTIEIVREIIGGVIAVVILVGMFWMFSKAMDD